MDEARKKLFGELMSRLKRPYSLCLYDGLRCENDGIRAHSIQNATILGSLSKDGHVVMPRLILTGNQPPRFQFQLIGRSNATTFSGLCAEHDGELFRPIDTNKIDLEDAEHLFLMSYRALLREAHTTRKAAIDSQMAYHRGVEEGVYPKDEACAPGEHAIDQLTSAWLVDCSRGVYEEISQNSNYHALEHRIVELDAGPSLAVSSMFSTGLFPAGSDMPCFVTLNIFPDNDGTIAVFSCEEPHRDLMAQAFDRIFQAEGHYLLYEVSKLVLRKCENFVVAPEVFESFSEQQVTRITEYYERNICGFLYEPDAPELFLFGPANE